MFRIRESVRGVESGAIIGKWEILGPAFSIGGQRWMVVAKCECGIIKAVDCGSLAYGGTGGCRRCCAKGVNLKHGDSAGREPASRLYTIHANMRQRCLNPNNEAFKDYGGRGIGIFQSWADSYEVFREWAMSNGYDDSKQIDRFPDNDGNYEPGNVRWVSCKQNQRNRRSNRNVCAFGETKCLAEWAEDARCVVKQQTLQYRIANGWNPEEALTKKAQ